MESNSINKLQSTNTNSNDTLNHRNSVSSSDLDLGCSLAELNLSLEEIEYIGGMFPKGRLSALVGESGKGKSWVATAAALSLVGGIPFLPTGNYPVRKDGKVLLIETEGRTLDYKERFLALSGGDEELLERVIVPDKAMNIMRYNSKDKQRLERIIEYHKVDLILLDSLSAFNNAEENTDAVMHCMKWLVDMAVKYNSAVVFTHLVNKSELKDGKLHYKSVRGFCGIYQMPVEVWAIDTPKKDDTLKRLYRIKNNAKQLDSTPIYFRLDNSQITFVDEQIKSRKEVKSTREEIFEANLHLTNSEIAHLMGSEDDYEANMRWLQRERKKLEDKSNP